jgi:hypothetical protein
MLIKRSSHKSLGNRKKGSKEDLPSGKETKGNRDIRKMAKVTLVKCNKQMN